MDLAVEWTKPLSLKDGRKLNLIYTVDWKKLPSKAGIYVFGRRYGRSVEALYVGKADQIQRRVKQQLNNLRLMQHLSNAKAGKRVVLAGRVRAKQGQQMDRILPIVERALIRYFSSEGHDLVNQQGMKLRRHAIRSSGRASFLPSPIYVEK